MGPRPRGSRIVRIARGWIGTPYHHGGRLKGVGVDCAGLPIGVARELGAVVREDLNYSASSDNLERMLAGVSLYCRQKPVEALRAGDILVFRSRTMLNHMAIYSGEGTIIHAYTSAGRVVEHGLSHGWRAAIHSVWRLRGAR